LNFYLLPNISNNDSSINSLSKNYINVLDLLLLPNVSNYDLPIGLLSNNSILLSSNNLIIDLYPSYDITFNDNLYITISSLIIWLITSM